MNSRERVLKALNFEEPDRVPLFDLLRNDAAIEHYAGCKLTFGNAEEAVHKALDAMLDMTRSVRYPHRPETKRDEDGFVRSYERWTTWVIERPFKTVGELARWAEQDIERMRAVNVRAWMADHVEQFARVQQAVGDTVVLWAFAGVGVHAHTHIAGWELFSYLYADDPGLLSEWIQAYTDLAVAKIKALDRSELSPVAFVGEDIAGNTGLLYSPSFLEREFFPRLERVVAAYHAKGIKVLFHSDGNIWDIMPDLIEAGIDGLNPLDRKAGMHPGPLKERYGDRLFLVGGIDCIEVLPHGTPEEVREATRRAIEEAAPGGGYFLGSSSELGPDIPLENILVMIETAKEVGTYPIAHGPLGKKKDFKWPR